MRFSRVLALFSSLLFVSARVINPRSPRDAGITAFDLPTETPSAHHLEKRKPKETIIIIIIIVRGVAVNGLDGVAPATEFSQETFLETFVSTSTFIPTGTEDAPGAFATGTEDSETVTLFSTRQTTLTTTNFALPTATVVAPVDA